MTPLRVASALTSRSRHLQRPRIFSSGELCLGLDFGDRSSDALGRTKALQATVYCRCLFGSGNAINTLLLG